MSIASFDHAAIPMDDVEAMLRFYGALGFTVNEERAPQLYSVHFGASKINLHAPQLWQSEKFTLRGPTAKPGCGDFCFVWAGTQGALDEMLSANEVDVIEGPAPRAGGARAGTARGMSTYVRDPDGNLLEFIIYGSPG